VCARCFDVASVLNFVQGICGVEINWETQEFKEPMRLHHWSRLLGGAEDDAVLKLLFRDPDCLKDTKQKLALDGWDIEDVVDFMDKQSRKMSTGTTENTLATSSPIVNVVFHCGGTSTGGGLGWCANNRIFVCSEDPYITNKPYTYGNNFANNPLLMFGFRQVLIRMSTGSPGYGGGSDTWPDLNGDTLPLSTITAFDKEFSAAAQRLNKDADSKTAFGHFTDHTVLVFPTKLMQQNVQTLWGDIFPYGTLDDSAFEKKAYLFGSGVEAPVDAFYSLPKPVSQYYVSCTDATNGSSVKSANKLKAKQRFCKGVRFLKNSQMTSEDKNNAPVHFMEVALIDKGLTSGFFAIGMAASSKLDSGLLWPGCLDDIYNRYKSSHASTFRHSVL
jgi:hypothetical protein